METVMISEIKGMLTEAKMEIDLVLDALENKIIIGEISHPVERKPKAKRGPRKRKDPAPFPDAEKRNLPDLDKENTFYSDKPKRGRKPKNEETTIQP